MLIAVINFSIENCGSFDPLPVILADFGPGQWTAFFFFMASVAEFPLAEEVEGKSLGARDCHSHLIGH